MNGAKKLSEAQRKIKDETSRQFKHGQRKNAVNNRVRMKLHILMKRHEQTIGYISSVTGVSELNIYDFLKGYNLSNRELHSVDTYIKGVAV